MPRTRHQHQQLQLIDIWKQNASQPIHRLIPELISEIFLHARPDVFVMRDAATCEELVRYLVDITSISGYIRHIALGHGELWSVMGFHKRSRERMSMRSVDDYYKRVLIVMEAFLDRAQRCNLHFFLRGGDSAPSWFHPRLLALIMPHIGRARTIHIRAGSSWNQLCVILNNAVNINNLSLNMIPSLRNPSTPPLNVLHNLKELTLSRIVYDESFHDVMKQVEKLDLDVVGADLWKWLGSFVRLKRLRIHDTDYTRPGLTDPNFLVRLESLVYLSVGTGLYCLIAPRLSLPHLRHLRLQAQAHEVPHLELQDYRHPPLRTLCISLDHEVSPLSVVMNPQLEYLEIIWDDDGYRLSKLLSKLLKPSQEPTPPGGMTTFPGPSLKYLRLLYPAIYHCTDYEARLLEHLASILSKAPHLELDVAGIFSRCLEGLMKRFSSQVKHYQSVDIPLDELYERSRKDSE